MNIFIYMKFIKKTIDEENICINHYNNERENSKVINYLNKINDKPWGKEYLTFQNNQIGIWILNINKNQETSLHCHFKKDTILIPMCGTFKINLFNKYLQIGLFESIYVPRRTFHGIHSYADNSILMEIELYTEHIQYTDKNDLLRLKDIYNRDKDKYETSVTERLPLEGETMTFEYPNKYSIFNTNVEIMKVNSLENIINIFDKIILLEGYLFGESVKITSGSFIEKNVEYSFLTDNITILCLSNNDYKNYNKIIHSKNQLEDLLKIKNLKNIGLTSGCFDILHKGHITNLKMCKKKCETLFVCLSSDEQIKRLKGQNRPINGLSDRINMLINYDFIDYIIIYNETDDNLEIELDNIINIVNPDIWFKGSDYSKDMILKKHPCLKKIELIDLVVGQSTTNIIKKIIT